MGWFSKQSCARCRTPLKRGGGACPYCGFGGQAQPIPKPAAQKPPAPEPSRTPWEPAAKAPEAETPEARTAQAVIPDPPKPDQRPVTSPWQKAAQKQSSLSPGFIRQMVLFAVVVVLFRLAFG